jgi:predicted kinase
MRKYLKNISFRRRFTAKAPETPPEQRNLVWCGNPMENLKKWLKTRPGAVADRDWDELVLVLMGAAHVGVVSEFGI